MERLDERERLDNNEKIKEFLIRNNSNNFRITEISGGLEGVLNKVRNEGGIKNIYQNGEIISSMGYLLKEEELYIYYLAIDKKYRKNPTVFKKVLSNIAKLAKNNNKKEITFKALVTADYNNRLYSTLAFSKEESANDAKIKSYAYRISSILLDKYKIKGKPIG